MEEKHNSIVYDDSKSNKLNIKKKIKKNENINIDAASIENIQSKVEKKRTQREKIEPKKNSRTDNNNKKETKKVPTIRESFFEKNKLKIIPLGGLEEVGKNITVFEYGNDIIVVDCGVAFPEDDMLGVDLVIPDITYLEKNKNKIRGMVITHGHEDHIGSIPYFLKKINVPIYATKLTVGLIKAKLEEHNLPDNIKIKCVEAGQSITLGKFKVEFIHTTH